MTNLPELGSYVNCRVPAFGVAWSETTGWSGNPGNGRGIVRMAHDDGSLDLEVLGPKGTAPELVRHVPRKALELGIGERHRDTGFRPIVIGPSWWPFTDRGSP